MKKEENLIFTIDISQNVDVLTISLKIQNKGAEEKQLLFSTGQKFEIIITNKENEEVYRYSRGRMFTQAFQTITLKLLEERNWIDHWDYQKNNQRVEAGEYLLTASIIAKKINSHAFPLKEYRISKKIIVPEKRG